MPKFGYVFSVGQKSAKKLSSAAPKLGADPFCKSPFSALRAAHPYQNDSTPGVSPTPSGPVMHGKAIDCDAFIMFVIFEIEESVSETNYLYVVYGFKMWF